MRRAGLHTQGFVSGYRGSPLGMVDQAIWKAGPKFTDAGIRFVPAINEELAATQVLGTQRVESDPERTVDGVFSMWYGKGPGVDRAGDAIKHGNAYGSSPHGGVLVVAGDDHGCVSSSMPHQSDLLFQAFHMPIVAPANVAEYLRVRPLRLGAVALLGQLGRPDGVVGGGGKRRHGRPRRDRGARRCVARCRCGACGHRPSAAGRRPALPLARPARRCASNRDCTTSWLPCARSRASTRSTAK